MTRFYHDQGGCCRQEQGQKPQEGCCRQEQSQKAHEGCCRHDKADSQAQEELSSGRCQSSAQGELAPSSSCDQEAATDEYKEKYLRLLAENENTRRRVQRDSQEAIRYAAQKIILDLLEPFDNFEKALFHAGYSPSEEVRNWAVGFKMIHQQFKDWLSAQGVHSFVSKGQPFNAQLHEAVETVATPRVREGTIVEEYSKGYKMHDRVLRVAKVSIAKPPASNNLEEAEAELGAQELGQNGSNSTNNPQQPA